MQVCLLYSSAPNMSRALLDMVLPRLRLIALKTLAKAYMPLLPVSVIASRLAFVKSHNSPDSSSSLELDTASQKTLPGCTTVSFTGRHAPLVSFLSCDHSYTQRLWHLQTSAG